MGIETRKKLGLHIKQEVCMEQNAFFEFWGNAALLALGSEGEHL
jgi:hypothetical protein